ncbi:MAG: ABC transporter substrate-binding protein [Acidimicrobiales bacterium]
MSRRRVAAAGLALALAAMGCAETDESDDVSAPATTDAGTAVTTEPDGTETGDEPPSSDTGVENGGTEPALQWALDYTGGSGGEATGEPITLGIATNTSLFPQVGDGTDLAVDFVNEQLGGVGGRPIELITCAAVAAEDGASCGAQFANDDEVVLAMVGAMVAGNDEFYAAISGITPGYGLGPLALGDYTTTDSVSYTSAALGAGMGGGLFVAEDLQPEVAALVVTDDAAGRGALSLLEPVLAERGVELVSVFVSSTATAPEIESAFRSTGADSVDAILIGLFEQGCIAAYDALRNLGVDALEQPVSTTTACWNPAFQEHVADSGEPGLFPNGWYFTNPLGYNLFEPDLESGIDTYRLVVDQAGAIEATTDVAAAGAFAGVLSMVRHLNAVDGDYSFDTLTAEIRDFEGPAMLQAGPITCGAPPVFKGVCSTRVSAHRYIDGGWENVRAGDDLIDITPLLIGEE